MVFNLLAQNNAQLQSKISIYNSLDYRKQVTAVALDFYEGRQADYVYQDIKLRDPKGYIQYYLLCQPITKNIINDISLITKNEPIRKIVGGRNPERNNRLWADDMKKMNYSSKMVQAEKMTNLTGSPIICVHWRNDPQRMQDNKVSFVGMPDITANNGHPVLDLVTYDTYDVAFGTNLEILELAYPISQGSFYGFDPSGDLDVRSQAVIVYWTPMFNKRIVPQGYSNQDVKGFQMNNPYGRIPAVVFHRSPPHRYFFEPVDESLIYCNMAVNVLQTMGHFIGRYQSHAQPTFPDGLPFAPYEREIGGQTPADELGAAANIPRERRLVNEPVDNDGLAVTSGGARLGPNFPIKQKFISVEQPHHLKALQDYVEHMLRMTAASHNLDPNKYIQMYMGPESAKSKWASEIKAEQVSKQERPQMASNEKALFEVIRAVRNYHAPASERYDDDCELEIVYRDNETPMDPESKFDFLITQYEAGFLGPIGLIREQYPHLSEADAIQKFNDIQAERAKYKIVPVEAGNSATGLGQTQNTEPDAQIPQNEDLQKMERIRENADKSQSPQPKSKKQNQTSDQKQDNIQNPSQRRGE